MYSWISPEGLKIRTTTVKSFVESFGFDYVHARKLACGLTMTMHGWCSTHKNAKRRRERFLSVLVNPKTGEREILGHSVKKFAEDHGMCVNELYKLVNRRKTIYKGWMLERTHLLVEAPIADGAF